MGYLLRISGLVLSYHMKSCILKYFSSYHLFYGVFCVKMCCDKLIQLKCVQIVYHSVLCVGFWSVMQYFVLYLGSAGL